MMDMMPADRSMLVKDPKDLVLSRFKHSEDTFKSLFMRCARWYDLYRGATSSGGFQSFRNNVSLPMLFSTIWSDVARKQSISFGTWPWVSFFGFGPEDAAKARKNELLVSAQMKDCRTYLKAVDMFLTADLYGTAIFRYGWKQEEERLLYRQAIEAAGKRHEKLATRMRETFNGPNWKPIDILDFFPQPAIRDINDMDWVIEREYVDLDELEVLSKSRSEEGIGEYDRTGYLKLKQSHMLREIDRQMEQRRNYIRSPFTEDEARKMEKYAKPVELLHMWGYVPSEFRSPDEAPKRVITLANRQVIMRNRPIPFWIGKIPYGSYRPLRDPHFFHGQGKMEVGERLQLTANRIANQKLDALDLFVDPVFAYDRQKSVDTRNLYMRSGKLVGVDGPPGDALMPIIPNLSQLREAYTEIEDLYRWLQEGTGIIEGQISPAPGSSRTTAREFLSRQEAASTRLIVETRFAEEMWLEPLANAFHALNKQFLPMPRQLRILGNEALVNPVTGQPQDPEIFSIDLEDVNQDYDVRARGATLTMSKAARQQNLVLLLQATQSHPMAMQLVNWVAFFRDMFRSFEMQNIDELLNPTPAQQQIAQQAMGGAQGAQVGAQSPAPSEDLLSAMALPGEQQIGGLEGTLSGF